MIKKLIAGAGIIASAVAMLPAHACTSCGCGIANIGAGCGAGCGLGTGIIGGLGCGIGYGLGCIGFGLGTTLPYWGMPWSWW